MKTELIDIFLYTMMIISIAISLPLVFKIVQGLSLLILNIVNPIKTIKIEKEYPNGKIETKTVHLNDPDSLINALLKKQTSNK